jgi:hypothetical protein
LIKRLTTQLWTVLCSFQLTVLSMALLMALVLLCTLAQVEMGTMGAVNHYMRAWIVYWAPKESAFLYPVFPGGILVGLVFGLNLFAIMVKRLKFTWAKVGLWVVHVGLVFLVAGEFVSAAYQVDTRMAIEEGQTVNFTEEYRDAELAVIDVTDPKFDDVYSIPRSQLASGNTVKIPNTPLEIRVKSFFLNADLTNRSPIDPPSLATAGVGTNVKVVEAAPIARDDENNRTSAFIEPFAGGRSYGTWLVSTVLGAPQSFIHEGRTYQLTMRPRRYYLPYSLTLKKFSHDVYPGTQIPKNFSSLVTLNNPSKGEQREVLIYMNQPLRYDGKAFYQASFGKQDTLTILQVVQNPGWLIPYISTVLVTIGLLVHFGMSLRRNTKRPATAKEA